VAYVSEQNLERDLSDEPVRHPKVVEALSQDGEGGWRVRSDLLN
jgi:heat shock protein HspQ